jgi:ribonuclease T2
VLKDIKMIIKARDNVFEIEKTVVEVEKQKRKRCPTELLLAVMTFLAIFVSLLNLRHYYGKPENTNFDLIIFTQRFPNTVCTEWMEKDSSNECILPKQNNSWTIQGVWPAKFHAKGPFFCDQIWHFHMNEVYSIKSELMEKWTNVEKNTPLDQLWKHEWAKHGTCAAKRIPKLDSQLKYFKFGLDLFNTYSITKLLNSTKVQPSFNATYKVEEIHAALETTLKSNFAIICAEDKVSKVQYLKEIQICFDKQLSMQSCNGIRINDEDTDDQIITNCKKDSDIFYPSFIH